MAEDTLFGRRRVASRWLGAGLGYGMAAGASAAGFGKFAPLAYRGGRELGDLIKTFTGFGAYEVGTNSLYEGSQAPFVRNFSSDWVLLSHREYVMDVYTGSVPNGFNLQSFMVNPGLSQLFEWLAQIAVNYEYYIPCGIIFEFRTMSADASSSSSGGVTLGTVIMCTNYNISAPNFASKAEMEASRYCMSSKPSSSMMHPIECDMSQRPLGILQTRAGTLPSGQDPFKYDLCNFQIATSGFPAVSVGSQSQCIGELWVSYEFAFKNPILYASLGRSSDYYYQYGGDPSANYPFGQNVITYDVKNNISIKFSSVSPLTTVTMPSYPMPVTYYMQFEFSSAPATVTTPLFSIVTPINCTVTSAVLAAQTPNSGVIAANCSVDYIVACSGGLVPCTFVLSIGSWPAFVASAVRCYQISG